MLLERATLPDGSAAFDERELTHMDDVRTIFGALLRAQLVDPRRARRARARARPDAPADGGPARACSPARSPRSRSPLSRVPFILLGFDRLLHALPRGVLRGRLVALLHTDTLIRIYPERLWQDVSQHRRGRSPSRRRSLLAPLAWWWLRAARRGARDRARARDGRRAQDRPPRCGALAPENTLRSFRAAVALGVDLVEFDVLDLPRGPLVIAHSDHLDEVSHGVAGRLGQVALARASCARSRPSCPRSTRRSRSSRTRRRSVGLHVDLKLTTRLDELAAALAALRARATHRRLLVPRAEPARASRATRRRSGSA